MDSNQNNNEGDELALQPVKFNSVHRLPATRRDLRNEILKTIRKMSINRPPLIVQKKLSATNPNSKVVTSSADQIENTTINVPTEFTSYKGYLWCEDPSSLNKFPQDCKPFYFCEKCSKRLFISDLLPGVMKSYKLLGIFCTACSVNEVEVNSREKLRPAATRTRKIASQKDRTMIHYAISGAILLLACLLML